MPFFSFEDLPPEAQERIRKEHDMHHMQHQFALHSINQLFSELTREQLQTVRMLIESATGDSNSGNHYLGRLTQILHDKHNICSCGENHDAEHENLTKHLYTASGERVERPQDETPQGDHSAAEEAAARAEREHAMEAYNVFDVPASGGKVVCRTEGCGTQWSSLTDRMEGRAGKGGCPACAQREAWG